MAPEVRSFPPPWARWVVVAALILAAAVGFAQEKPLVAENTDAVAARARLLQELDRQIEQRRLEVAREAQSLDALRRALEAATRDLEAQQARLEVLKRELEADIARREKVVDERLDQIAKVYAAMKPREASTAIAGLDDPTALAILERLPGRTVGKIFNLMDKDRVRELTRLLEKGRVNQRE